MSGKSSRSECSATAPAFAASTVAVSSSQSDCTLFHAPRVRAAGNRRRMAVGIALSVLALAAVAVAGWVLSDAATVSDFAAKNLPPALAHPFGTDWMGRDMFLRTLAGLSTSIFVGLLAATVSSLIALSLAALAAFGGPRADAVVGWLIDLVMGIPHIVLLILISYALGKGFWGVTVGVAVTHWPSLTRVLRAEILQCREQPFMAVSAHLGVTRVRLVLTHVLPYVLPQLVVGLVLMFPHAILHEASITFLGFGLSPDEPAIGVILSESMSYLSAGMWWLAAFPGVALVACVALFGHLGDLARRLVDARTVQE